MNSVIINAHIRTMSPAMPEAQALALRDGRIVAVGTEDEALEAADADARRIDAAGLTIVPGFNDCHMHILPYGLDLLQADLSPAAGVDDVPTLIAALRRWHAANPQNEWILGSRYDQNIFPGAAHPTRADLDAAFPDHPVCLRQTSKHASAANSVALRLAGITRDTPNPEGGEIVRDAHGEPTGVLLEAAMSLVTRCLPRPDRTALIAAVHRANEALVRAGITSASDLNTGWLKMETEIACYRQAAMEGAPVRTTLFPHAPDFGKPDDIPMRLAFERDLFADPTAIRENSTTGGVRLGPIKLFSDGALTVRTAVLRQPYADGSGTGMLLHPPEELTAYIVAAHHGGWQIAVHAIGDRAVEQVLDAYAEAQKQSSRSDARHRIEHAMLLDEALIRRFVEQQVLPVVQPEFVARLGDAYVLALGADRAARLNPTASLLRAGLGVPFSSDCPIVPGAPLDGLRAAVYRRARSGRVLGPEECISAADALRNYTYWAAYSSFDEQETGTIEPGKRADLTVLSADPTTADLDAVRVVATIIDGETVFGKEAL